MALVCVGVMGLGLLAISFTGEGLLWWFRLGWPLHMGPLLVSLPVISLALMWIGTDFDGLLRSKVVSALTVLCLVSIASLLLSMMTAPLARSQIINIGWLSLDRARVLNNALEARDARISVVDPQVAREIAFIKQALAYPSHENLKEAYGLLDGGLGGVELSRAMDAALLLGLHREPVIMAAKQRGWMRPGELDQLRSLARSNAASTAPEWNELQQAAFLALTQDNGLLSDLKMKDGA